MAVPGAEAGCDLFERIRPARETRKTLDGTLDLRMAARQRSRKENQTELGTWTSSRWMASSDGSFDLLRSFLFFFGNGQIAVPPVRGQKPWFGPPYLPLDAEKEPVQPEKVGPRTHLVDNKKNIEHHLFSDFSFLYFPSPWAYLCLSMACPVIRLQCFFFFLWRVDTFIWLALDWHLAKERNVEIERPKLAHTNWTRVDRKPRHDVLRAVGGRSDRGVRAEPSDRHAGGRAGRRRRSTGEATEALVRRSLLPGRPARGRNSIGKRE